MKKSILAWFILPLLGIFSCQEKPVDLNAEKAAILETIQKESEYARDGKFQEFTDLYVHDDYNTRITTMNDTLVITKGWANIYDLMEYIQERDSTEFHSIAISKENPIVKVTGNTAWVTCDNIWKGIYQGQEVYSNSIQITFLEKVEGKWKISFSAWVQKPGAEEPEEVEGTEE